MRHLVRRIFRGHGARAPRRGSETSRHAITRRGARGAMRDCAAEIRSPLPEGIVDVDRRHTGGRGATLETRERRFHRFRVRDKDF